MQIRKVTHKTYMTHRMLSLGMVLSLALLGIKAFADTSSPLVQLKAQAAALGVSPSGTASAPDVREVAAQPKVPEKEAVAALFADPKELRMSATCEISGRKITVPVLRWETGVLLTKDINGREVRQEYKYPIFKPLGDVHALGDGQLCWQVCKQMCSGSGVCWLSCTYHCTSQGGSGDPRPK